MASRLPAAVDTLRRHLHDAIPDTDDLQQADQYIFDLLNSLHDNGDDEGGEPEGERLTASGQAPSVAGRTGFDRKPLGMGLDRALVGARVRKATPSVLDKLLAGVVQPGRSEFVR